MEFWLIGGFVVFVMMMIARAFVGGKKEAARMNFALEDLEQKACPACERAYGPINEQASYLKFLPGPDFEDSTCENYWRVRCPRCGHEAIVGFPREATTLVFVRVREAPRGPKGRAPK